LLAPGGRRGKLNVFIFHRVRPGPDPLFPWDLDAKGFAALLTFLSRWFNVLPLSEALARLADRSLPPAAASLTFDDGYADNFTVALPLLKRYAMPATVFVASGYLNGGRMWNDTIIEAIRTCPESELDLRDDGLPPFALGTAEAKRQAIDALLGELKYRPAAEREALAGRVARRARAQLPNDLMLTSDQARELRRGGVEIGAHTVRHPILARTPEAEAEREIRDSKRELENLLGAEVPLFAYPNGQPGKDYGEAHVGMVRRAGFRGAFSTARGVATESSNPLELPRFTPWGRSPMFALRLARHLAGGGARHGQVAGATR